MSHIIDVNAVVRINLGSREFAQMIRDALLPETTSSPTDRARVKIDIYDTDIQMEIQAGDLTAFRASMNSYLSWVWSCQRTIDSITGQNP